MNRSDEFIQLYKTLEDLLEAKYREEGREVSSCVYQFLCDKESMPFRIKLDLCRQVRNLLSHSADVDGVSPVTPAEPLIKCLKDVIAYLKKPILASERGATVQKLLKATVTDRVLWLTKKMEDRGYSHVPVLEKGKVIGVFSVSTFFSLGKDGKLNTINENTLIGEILPYISFANHSAERFLFASKDDTVIRIRSMFSSRKPGEKRVAGVFITHDGTENTRLVSYITPWDVMD
ncbi:MAG: CBS domain-containing protein [Clostridia bacterium]|nr:CBS domain-containing protein [Clostridia bacterium]